MARGRRPDNSLEPSRQLLTQRAFRQRRAAHLAELEAKVRRLEKENASLKGIAYVEEEDSSKNTKRAKTSERESRSVSGEAFAMVEDVEEEEDESELICERCAMYDRDRLETLNAVSAVDNCLSHLSESIQMLRRDLSKHSEKPIANRQEAFGSISPLQTHQLQMPIYQGRNSAQTSPLSDTTSQTHHQLFLEVPSAPSRYNDASDATSATSISSNTSQKLRSPISPISPFQMMNLGDSSDFIKFSKKKSHSRISNSVDEGQSKKAQSMTSMPPYHRSAASVSSISSIAGPSSMSTSNSLPTTCSPRGGGCCSNKREAPVEDALERAKSSTMPQARDGKSLEMSTGTKRLLEHYQQQQQSQQLHHQQPVFTSSPSTQQRLGQTSFPTPLEQDQKQSYMEQLQSSSNVASPLPQDVPKSQNFTPSQEQSMNFPQIQIDETKCCLGIFECDSHGNILVPQGS